MISVIIVSIVVGGITGALARLALPGRDPMSIPQTILVGIGGSMLAGVIVFLLSGGRATAGWFASFVGATAIVYLIRKRRGGGLTSPGRVDSRDNFR